MLAPAGADKAPFPLVGYAGIQLAIHKRVPAGAPAGARSYYLALYFCNLNFLDYF